MRGCIQGEDGELGAGADAIAIPALHGEAKVWPGMVRGLVEEKGDAV